MAEHLTRPSGRLTRRTLLSRIARGAVALSLGVGLVPSQAAQADDTPPGYGTPTASQPAPTAVPAGTRAPAPPAATPAPAATAVPVATPVVAATPVFPPASYSTDLLVDTMWLMEHLADPQLKLIELSEDAAYMSGHLPSAGHLRWEDLKLVDSNSATLAAWRDDVQARLGALGITPADPVVVYDDGSLWAARVWWILEALGHRDKRVLDGGKPAWTAAGEPLSTDSVSPAPASYEGTPNLAALATAEYVASRLGAPDLALVDARRPEEYSGQDNDGTARGGHIPGAVNIPFDQVAIPGSPRYYLPPDKLAELYVSRGVTPDKEVIAYCATGVRSAVTYFSLRLLGYPRVLLYSASWAEWGNRLDLPVAT